jgi:hypothetical protein
MTNEKKVTNWLENNTDLSWTRTNGDSPAVRDDRLYINRSEGYEIRDLILNYYKNCNLAHKDENYVKTFNKIIKYKKGEKVKTEDILRHLKNNNENCK